MIGLRLAFLVLISTIFSAALPVWADGPTGRIAPLSESKWSPELQKLLGQTHDRVAKLEGGVRTDDAPNTLNILKTMAHHPQILRPFLGFATAIAQEGALSRRDSELLALRASWNCRSDFEWGHHVEYARVEGMSEVELERIPRGPTAKGWSAEDRVLLQAADQLHAGQQIDDEVWRQLAGRFSEAQLVEIPFVVGQYTMLSMIANSTGVVLEPGYDRLPVLGR